MEQATEVEERIVEEHGSAIEWVEPLVLEGPAENPEITRKRGEETRLEPGEVNSPYRHWLTTQGVGAVIGLSIQRVAHHIDNGRLTYIRTPLGRLFEPASVQRFKEERESERRERAPYVRDVAKTAYDG